MGVLCALILPAVLFRGHSGEGELASPFGVVLLFIVFCEVGYRLASCHPRSRLMMTTAVRRWSLVPRLLFLLAAAFSPGGWFFVACPVVVGCGWVFGFFWVWLAVDTPCFPF